eukprot:TRINITY_DN9874_c0_g1_i2.p1 TRINITY_DN9874_c0_g1~~TRINITY_DN9874_c0_g1_i2.p1  ORF type:complete len:128 (-),score=22.39 TRINITY_DN9874_c0_g1_i2:80-463(-)
MATAPVAVLRGILCLPAGGTKLRCSSCHRARAAAATISILLVFAIVSGKHSRSGWRDAQGNYKKLKLPAAAQDIVLLHLFNYMLAQGLPNGSETNVRASYASSGLAKTGKQVCVNAGMVSGFKTSVV